MIRFTISEVEVCNWCMEELTGEPQVQCNSCQQYYHESCVVEDLRFVRNWTCYDCERDEEQEAKADNLSQAAVVTTKRRRGDAATPPVDNRPRTLRRLLRNGEMCGSVGEYPSGAAGVALSRFPRGGLGADAAATLARLPAPKLAQQALPPVSGLCNKLFSSAWLNTNTIIAGTKDARLILYDVKHRITTHIVPTCAHPVPGPWDSACSITGIHFVEPSPQQTHLLTMTANPRFASILSLEDFQPTVLLSGHTDGIFGGQWLDHRHVVTVSRDREVAMWDVSVMYEDGRRNDTEAVSAQAPATVHPVASNRFHNGRVRDVAATGSTVSPRSEATSFLTVSEDRQLVMWDPNFMQPIRACELSSSTHELNTCHSDPACPHLGAVGHHSGVTLVDVRVGRATSHANIYNMVRSVRFNGGNIISAGTGNGKLLLMDKRMLGRPPLQEHQPQGARIMRDYNFHTVQRDAACSTAIYTHEWEPTGQSGRLFAGGGPLATGLTGDYASLFTPASLASGKSKQTAPSLRRP
jgi:hypothetical protein